MRSQASPTPSKSESERACARVAGSALYVVHVTCAEALSRIQEAQARGEPVMAETCTHYLVLDETALASPGFDGAKYVCSPPLRDRSNQAALWAGLRTGALRVVSSDHCSFNLAGQKELGKDNFALIPNGLAGIEERVMLLYSEGVRAGRLDLNRFVDAVSTAPARIFGLYPAKGTIAIGSDADVVVFDPNRERSFSVRHQHQRLDHIARVVGPADPPHHPGAALAQAEQHQVAQPGALRAAAVERDPPRVPVESRLGHQEPAALGEHGLAGRAHRRGSFSITVLTATGSASSRSVLGSSLALTCGGMPLPEMFSPLGRK